MECDMATKSAQINARPTLAMFATIPLPLEPLTVRIPVAVQLTGIGRSKLYQLIAAGEVETVKVGASTLVSVASLKRLIETRRR
jgi:excisionase family DNA binding protein